MQDPTFWSLESHMQEQRLARGVKGEVNFETLFCPIDDGHQRAGKRLSNLSVSLPRPPVEDFVWTWLSDCLIKDSVLELFKKNGFSGFDVKPVRAIFKRSDTEPPPLWELLETGSGGIAPPESGIRFIGSCPGCSFRSYSAWTDPERLIDQSQWDGSDFFSVWPVHKLFITERVMRAIRDNKLKGYVVKPLREVVFPKSIIPEVNAGPLPERIPRREALELCAKLGGY
jgi:hypothetical protein